jgi:hypothetical protein
MARARPVVSVFLLEEKKQPVRAGILPKPSRFAIRPGPLQRALRAFYSSLRAGKYPNQP